MAINGKSRRSYRGAPVSNTLGVTLSEAATNITLAIAMAGWSTDGEPFFVVVDPGTAKEEKICVKYSSATTLTVVDPSDASVWNPSAEGRGADNTTDRQHEQGAVIYPVFTALEAGQANELVSKYANAGSVVYQGSGALGTATFAELPIGSSSQVLRVNAGLPQWGQVAEAGIADSAITSAKILDGTIVAGDISTGAITSDKILNNTIVLGDLATALQAFLVPIGSINAYGGTTAPAGWLMCDGSAIVSKPLLVAVLGGATTTPDLRGKFPMGKTAAGTGSTLLGAGGSTTISISNMPSHSHLQSSHNHTQTDHSHNNTVTNNTVNTGDDAPDHTHNYTAVGASGTTISSGTGTIVGTTTSGGANQRHLHAVTSNVSISNAAAQANINPATAVNLDTGGGSAYFQPFIAVNYIIKHD